MALNFSLADVENFEELKVAAPEEGEGMFRWCGLVDTVAWMAMAIDYGKLKTDADCEEFFRRAFLWERVNGAMRVGRDEETGKRRDVYLKLDEVQRLKGFWCNVATKSRTSFGATLNRCGDDKLRDAKRDAKRDAETAKAEAAATN